MKRVADADISKKSEAELRQELIRVRNAIRRHRKATGNARCWHNDLQLYERSLPDSAPAGKMTQPMDELLQNCRRYIRRQQCGPDCVHAYYSKG